MHRGYIKLHRKMNDNPVVMKDPDHIALWVHLLLKATHTNIHKQFGGQFIELQAGQLITGQDQLSRELKIEPHKVYRILNLFKREKLIEKQTCSKGTLITLLNWNKYQNCEEQNEKQMRNERETSEKRVRTNNNVNNINNINNDKNVVSGIPTLEEIKAYFDNMHYIDPVGFYDYNNGRGWKVGNNIITNWHSMAKLWNDRGPANTKSSITKKNGFNDYEETNAPDLDEMERLFQKELNEPMA